MKEVLQTAPRWFIVFWITVISSVSWVLLSFVIKNAYGQIQTNSNEIRRMDKISAETAQGVSILREEVSSIKKSQEQFRVEYREDRKDMDQKLDEQYALLTKISGNIKGRDR